MIFQAPFEPATTLLHNHEWFIIVAFMFMIVNIYTLTHVKNNYYSMRIVFLICGVLIGGMSMIELDTVAYPFVQLLLITFSMVINFGVGGRK